MSLQSLQYLILVKKKAGGDVLKCAYIVFSDTDHPNSHNRLILKEVADGVSVEHVKKSTGAKFRVADDLKKF